MSEKWNTSWDDEVAKERARQAAEEANKLPPKKVQPPPPPLARPVARTAAPPSAFTPHPPVSLNCPRCGDTLSASSVPNTGVCGRCKITVPLGGAQTPTLIIQQANGGSGSKAAAVLINALLLPGVGQLMLGKSTLGVVLLLAWIASIALMCTGIGFFTAPIVWLIAVIDAAVS